MARPLKGSRKVVGPHAQIPKTPASHQDHHVDISHDFGSKAVPTAKAGARMHDSYPPPQNAQRSGRSAKKAQPAQRRSKAAKNPVPLS